MRLVHDNSMVIKCIVESIGRFKSDAVAIVIINPVGVLTGYLQEPISLPREQVIGSGTWLDT